MKNELGPPIAIRPRLASPLIVSILSALSSLLLIGCASPGPAAANFSYRTPFIPVTFSVDTNGHISISLGGSITTPLGTFSVGAEVGVPIGKNSTRLSIVHTVGDASVKDVYDIGERGPMNVCLDGRFWENVGEHDITITPLDGTSTISIVRSGSHCSAASPSLAANPQPSSSAPQEISTPSPQVLPAIAGTWTGTYTCAQGLTGLRLTINNSGGGALTATFVFYAVPSNPGVPSGSFAMTGTYSASGLVLNQDHWINEPSGYSMVDLVAPPPTGNTLQGTVQAVGGCTSFSVSR